MNKFINNCWSCNNGPTLLTDKTKNYYKISCLHCYGLVNRIGTHYTKTNSNKMMLALITSWNDSNK